MKYVYKNQNGEYKSTEIDLHDTVNRIRWACEDQKENLITREKCLERILNILNMENIYFK